MAKYRTRVSVILLALFVAVVMDHAMAMVYGDDLRRSIFASAAVLDGKPHWILFQNRLLGPFLATMFMRATAAPEIGYTVYTLICFTIAFVLAWRIGRVVVGSRAGALAIMLTLATGLVALYIRYWFYAWDVIGLPIFMIFAWLVVTDAKRVWFVVLYVVALWNREDALFIGLFLTLQPFTDWWLRRGSPARPPIAWRQVMGGVACFVGGMILVMLLRRLLLVQELGPLLFGPQLNHTSFFQWNLESNFDFIFQAAHSLSLEIPVFVALPPVVVLAACIYLACVPGGRYLNYALTNLAMAVATFLFGYISEMRIWVDLLPAVTLAAAIALARADAPDRAAGLSSPADF